MTDAAAESTMREFHIIFAIAAHPEAGCILPGHLGGLRIFSDTDAAEAYLSDLHDAFDAISNDCDEWNAHVDAYEDGDGEEEWEGRTHDATACVWGEWLVTARDEDSLGKALEEDYEEVLTGHFIDGSDKEAKVLAAIE
ncbi:MAG: hypothetical protein EA402_13290 [Planctomycetota bacterium]|nr:MAG: hypothetical protein EA402_13290 [Planctomycetota bacterium]